MIETIAVKRMSMANYVLEGSSLSMGYWNNLEKTEAVFAQNPLNKSYPEKIYRTGDIVFTNKHGEIIFVGRKDFQIKTLGLSN